MFAASGHIMGARSREESKDDVNERGFVELQK